MGNGIGGIILFLFSKKAITFSRVIFLWICMDVDLSGTSLLMVYSRFLLDFGVISDDKHLFSLIGRDIICFLHKKKVKTFGSFC